MKISSPPTVLILLFIFTSCASSKQAQIREKKVDRLVAEARSYTGTPYRYGGTTRSGMDCSALLLNSYQVIGVNIPRTSNAQSEFGDKVKFGDLEPGDLVFFSAKPGKRKITHAGMVTVARRGEVKFIHASTKLGVVENDLNSDYYKKRFVKARRVL